MDETNLKDVLKECNESAKIGYKIASEQEKNLNRTLDSAQKEIQNTIQDFQRSPCYASGTTELLEKQLKDIKKSFKHLSYSFNEDLQNLQENMSHFSVTLFGRTMAGKSTLMEILTEGDGSSIGKGAQRTTRDIRKYTWNGLEITDVPGIGAFEGEDDEQIAFESAKTSDLILFLITDDAPQAVEAECLSRIVNLGKPIICVMNIKASIAEEKSLKLALRDVNKRFDMERLEKIRNQFLKFSEQAGQTWDHIPFVYVHLKSAYSALKVENLEKRKGFSEISRIDYLKKRIVLQIRTKGKFYRIKNFIDIISNPVLESMEKFLEQSRINSVQGRTIHEKKRQLKSWKDTFCRDAKTHVNSLIVKIESELNGEISSFAEEHYDDNNADKAWNELLKSRKIDVKCQELLEDLESECNNKLKEISREVTNELKFVASFEDDESLRMPGITDSKKIYNWSSVALSGVLSIALTSSLWWVFLGVPIIGCIGEFFFDSRDKKESEARIRLEKKLRANISKTCDILKKDMNKSLDSLVSKIDGLMAQIDKINSVIFHLADTQKELAWKLNNHLIKLNCKIIAEAIRLIGAEGLEYHVQSVSRIPGNISLILLRDGTVFPKDEEYKLHELTGEKICFVYNSENKQILISPKLYDKV